MSRSGAGVRRGVAAVFASPVVGQPVRPRNAPAPVTTAFDQEPEPAPADVASAPSAVLYTERFTAPQASDVTLAQATVEDIDQLWDWVRADREGTTAFLGLAHLNTASFFSQIAQIGQKEREGVAWLRSIKRSNAVIGFVILDPIQRGNPPIGRCHIYVSPDERGSLPELLPSLLAEADRLLPGVTLFVATDQDAMATLLKSAGFTAQIVLTRPSQAGVDHGPQAV